MPGMVVVEKFPDLKTRKRENHLEAIVCRNVQACGDKGCGRHFPVQEMHMEKQKRQVREL